MIRETGLLRRARWFYVLLGACFMPVIEDIDFITSVYTNVMSVTAVDFSIIVGGKLVFDLIRSI